MKEVHGRSWAGFRVFSALAVAVVVCLLAACAQAGPSQSAKYVLTVQNNGNCTTVPSGAVSVEPGAATTIAATANPSHSWPVGNVWTVVSGIASITDPSQATTTVTLSAGDATIKAVCP
jgi:hypothetical protein